MLDRWVEGDLLPVTDRWHGRDLLFAAGAGQLTDKYLNGIPADSRAASGVGFLKPEHLTADRLARIRRLNDLAKAAPDAGPDGAGVGAAHAAVTSALIGRASRSRSGRTWRR